MLAGGDKDLRAKALDAANKAPAVSPAPTTPAPSGFSASASFGGATASFNKPAFGAAPLGGNTASSFAPAPSWGTTPVATSSPMMSATGKPIVTTPRETPKSESEKVKDQMDSYTKRQNDPMGLKN
jgi:hypothetical protein